MELNYFIDRKRYLEDEIARLSRAVDEYPPGDLAIYVQEGYPRWQVLRADDSGKKQYIRKNDRGRAEVMAQKALDKMKLEDLTNELECVTQYLDSRREPDWAKLLGDDSYYKGLLGRNSGWEYEPYDYYKEFPQYKTVDAPKGEKVRSKSEAMIAFSLYDHGIPYHYEECYEFDGALYAPDFTIRHPKTDMLYIWEHFGMIEKPSYQMKFFNKLPVYVRHGFVPGVNFIMTFETEGEALSIMNVNRIVQETFLS